MTLLFALAYVALCILLLKAWPLQRGRLPTILIGGVTAIVILALTNHYHPRSLLAASDLISRPVVSDLTGRVVELALDHQRLNEGDLLLRFDSEPFDAEIASRRDALATARERRQRLQAELERAEQQLVRLGNEQDQQLAGKQQTDPQGGAQEGQEPLSRYRAMRQQSLQAIQTRQNEIKHQNILIEQQEKALEQVMSERDRLEIRAPEPGYVSRIAVTTGTHTDAQSNRPLMFFVPARQPYFTGAFAQHSALQLLPGREAELILPAFPGRVFRGRVIARLPSGREDVGQWRGAVAAEILSRPGLVVAEVELAEDLSSALPSVELLSGLQPEIVVYSSSHPGLAMLRRILLRMKSWQYYLLFPWR